MNDKEKQIEEMAREIARVLFEIRQDMTSVIRYIRHDVSKEKELYSDFTLGHFIDRHLKYRQLADETSSNILKNLNENSKLKEIENLCVNIARNGFPKDSVVLTREEYVEYVELRNSEVAELVKENKVLGKQCLDWMKLYHKQLTKTKQARKETAKTFASHIESYLAYHNDEDTLTKNEILMLVKEILKEEYKIETLKE